MTGARQSLFEYILVIVLVIVVLAVALITLGESKEDYIEHTGDPDDIEEVTDND